jgi:1-pyrroline-5-carboxylate dehydrogenase
VIPPWNFAFAIMAGMTTARAGSLRETPVVLKPSSDAAVIAACSSICCTSRVAAGRRQLRSGIGTTIGEALVAHPKTRFIAFTGSKEVGLHINELAAKTQPGQRWIKRVIAEMGGKDSIVVAADADFDEGGRRRRRLGLRVPGQKCSACSRAIVERDGLRRVPRAAAQAVETIGRRPGSAGDVHGPVINEGRPTSILGYIASVSARAGCSPAGSASPAAATSSSRP